MATAYKILGQLAPDNTTDDQDLYTVPSATEAVVSTIVVANRTATARTFRISIRPTATSIANQHWIAYDVPIAANDSTTLTLGVTLGAADRIGVRSSASDDLSFHVFGTEIS